MSAPAIITTKGDKVIVMDDMLICHPNSTAIYDWCYHEDDQWLFVSFASQPGRYFVYGGVGYDAIVGLMKADSVGSYFAKFIKPCYSLV
jgi:hypothetical protein